MTQADQSIQNDTFPTVRADINNNLAALFSNNSGNAEPTVRVAYMDWIDTSGANPVWKKRNATNTAWITLGTIVSNSIAFEGTLPNQTSNAGKYLSTNGTTASWDTISNAALGTGTPDSTSFLRGDRTWQPLVIAAANIEVFASSGTWTCPAGVTKVTVTVIGGGGGGAFSSPINVDGGFGGVGTGSISVTPNTNYTITVGAGGAGVNGGNGTAGGNSSFGSTITATGGGGGVLGSTATNGTCSNAAANLARSHAGTVTVPYIGRSSTVRTGSTTSVAWDPTLSFCPGAAGKGLSNNSACGGVGGAILLQY